MKLNVDYKPLGEEHERTEFMEKNCWRFQFEFRLGKVVISVICHKDLKGNIISHGDEERPFEVATFIGGYAQEPIGYMTEKQVNDYLKEMENRYGI